MEIETQCAPMPVAVHKGPVEGILIVNGHPQTERLDMPIISFKNVEAMLHFLEEYNSQKNTDIP